VALDQVGREVYGRYAIVGATREEGEDGPGAFGFFDTKNVFKLFLARGRGGPIVAEEIRG